MLESNLFFRSLTVIYLGNQEEVQPIEDGENDENLEKDSEINMQSTNRQFEDIFGQTGENFDII